MRNQTKSDIQELLMNENNNQENEKRRIELQTENSVRLRRDDAWQGLIRFRKLLEDSVRWSSLGTLKLDS